MPASQYGCLAPDTKHLALWPQTSRRIKLNSYTSSAVQALVAFEGCKAVLLDKASEADAAVPSAESQAKLQEVQDAS